MLELLSQHPLLTATGALLLLGVGFGALLGFASVKFHVEGNPVSEQINALLPQTQCGQCGYPGCKPYSEAVAQGDAINKCVPGGQATVEAIADLPKLVVLARKAVEASPEQGEPLLAYGAALYRASRYQEAAEQLDAALKKRVPERGSIAQLFRAMTHHQLRQKAEAEKLLRRSLGFGGAN